MRHFVFILLLLMSAMPPAAGNAHAQVAGELEAPLGATVRVTTTRVHADRLRGTLVVREGRLASPLDPWWPGAGYPARR